MRRSIVARSLAAVIAVVLAASPAATQTPPPPQPVPPVAPQPVPPLPVPPAAPLTLPVTGTTSTGEKFTGNLSLHRFVARGSELKAVVTVTGTVSDPTGVPAGSFLNGLVETPVEVSQAGPTAVARQEAPATPGEEQAPGAPPGGGATPPQTPGPECALIQLEISGLTLNVLGLVVTVTSPVVLYLGGDTAGGQLGVVVCQIVDSLNNVTSLAGLLNVLLTLLASPSAGV